MVGRMLECFSNRGYCQLGFANFRLYITSKKHHNSLSSLVCFADYRLCFSL